jgi:hypothetical protein
VTRPGTGPRRWRRWRGRLHSPGGPRLGFAEFAVRGTLGFDHVFGHAESDGAVDRSAVVGVLDDDLVAEESRRACAGVGDQRFLLRQLQLEVITQERREACFDLLGFGLRPGEPEELIICLPGIAEPTVAGVADESPLQSCPCGFHRRQQQALGRLKVEVLCPCFGGCGARVGR